MASKPSLERRNHLKYITTAIDYPNATPHVGTAFEKITADAYNRYLKFKGESTFFLLGNDENTQKVTKKAKELNIPTQEYVDNVAVEFKSIWKSLNIDYDNFVQTSKPQHTEKVKELLLLLKPFIYKSEFKGSYCEGCEEYKTECLYHPITTKEETNYFFKLSKFKKNLPNVKPEKIINEIDNIEPKDISISRKNEGWGIPIPWDNQQVTYVWVDALLSYYTASPHWPAYAHFIGKDITRFHTVLWPALLQALNLPIPENVFVHGFINQNKNKISKSNNNSNLTTLIKKYGADATRYYFLKCDFFQDNEYTIEHFHQTYNSDLVNELGNLVSRIAPLPFVISPQSHFWQIPDPIIESCNFKTTVENVWSLIRQANAYVDLIRPWENKDKTLDLIAVIRIISLLLIPLLPETANKIYYLFFKEPPTYDLLKKIMINNFYNIQYASSPGKIPPLFPRIVN